MTDNIQTLITKTEALLDASTQGEKWIELGDYVAVDNGESEGDDYDIIVDAHGDNNRAALIAHAPSALRQLIAEVNRLQVKVGSHEEWQREYCEEMKGGMP